MNRSILIQRGAVNWLALSLFVTGAIISMGSPDTIAAEDDPPPIFYPPAPADPKLQYLKKFSSALDLAAKSSRMRDFVFGGAEFEGHDVQKPYGVTIFSGAIYVVDTEQGGYVVFDLVSGKTRLVRGGMRKPGNISIDHDGTRYITDAGRGAIFVFDKNDRFIRTHGSPDLFKPVDVAITGDRLYVTDSKNMKVHVLDKLTGEPILDFGGPGTANGKFYHPTNLALGPDGTLYVTDTTNFRIQHFTLDGEFIRSIGKIGTSAGKFARPKGVAVDHEGRIYVVDAAFENVQVLDSDGTPLTVFGWAGNMRGGLNLPTVVKVDYDNVEYFQKYSAPGFELEYLVLVASQFGTNKVSVFGFGAMTDDLDGASEGGR
jgi:DNA-binding beta-propeller fold protein YncE